MSHVEGSQDAALVAAIGNALDRLIPEGQKLHLRLEGRQLVETLEEA